MPYIISNFTKYPSQYKVDKDIKQIIKNNCKGSLDLFYYWECRKVVIGTLAKLDGVDRVTEVEDAVAASANVGLCQNYPNPFNPSTLIEYSISQQSSVTLKKCLIYKGEKFQHW